MEKTYWLSRKRASLAMAKNAAGAEARLIHYDLAGRYSLNAASAPYEALDLEVSYRTSILVQDANIVPDLNND
jgi:hypothetical protein